MVLGRIAKTDSCYMTLDLTRLCSRYLKTSGVLSNAFGFSFQTQLWVTLNFLLLSVGLSHLPHK